MQKHCIGCGVQRWHTCDRCSKPIFHEDGPDTECERCNPLNDELMKMYHDDYGHPIWCAERDRPILGYTKISRGLYAGLFGAIWRYNVAHAPILEAGTVITMKSKRDNEGGGQGAENGDCGTDRPGAVGRGVRYHSHRQRRGKTGVGCGG